MSENKKFIKNVNPIINIAANNFVSIERILEDYMNNKETSKSFVRWEQPPRDYTKDDEETKKHTAYCYCKCPLPLNYAICIDKNIATKSECGFYAFYCPNCKTAGLVFGGDDRVIEPSEMF